MSATRARGSNVGAHIILGLGAVTMLFPFLWMGLVSLQTKAESLQIPPTWLPAAPKFGNYSAVLDVIPLLDQLKVSLIITVLRTVAQLVLCSLAGYALARMKFRGRGLILVVSLSVLMVPPQAFIQPQYELIHNLNLLNTVTGLVLPGFFSAFGTFMMRQFFLTLPNDVVEAARLDGASAIGIFWRIMLPLAAPGLQALAIITVLWSWSDLMWPLVITTRAEDMPASVGIASLGTLHDPNYPQVMAAAVMTLAPVLIAFIVFQRRVLAGVSMSAR
jgi:multiple sugar transport system permease protein